MLACQLNMAREVVEPLVLLQPRVVKPRVGGQQVYVRPVAHRSLCHQVLRHAGTNKAAGRRRLL